MSKWQRARESGWLVFLQRATAALFHRVRDRAVTRKMGTTGFHCRQTPRLIGLSYMHIGRNFTAGDSLWLEAVSSYGDQTFSPSLTIGDEVSASDAVHIACVNSVTIGTGTLLGSRVLVTDHAHGIYRGPGQSSPEVRPELRPLFSEGTVVIGSNVWIGDGVAVLAGAEIGDGCVIGANSVVTGAIPAGTIAVGAPARPVRRWDATAGEWVGLGERRAVSPE